MFVMTPQILKLADLWKTQKPKYFQNTTQFFPPVKKLFNCTFRTKNSIK